MLIPQFSLRWLLGTTTIAALALSIVALGLHGTRWAAAVSVGMLALVVLAFVHMVLFTVVWSISAIRQRQSRARTLRENR